MGHRDYLQLVSLRSTRPLLSANLRSIASNSSLWSSCSSQIIADKKAAAASATTTPQANTSPDSNKDPFSVQPQVPENKRVASVSTTEANAKLEPRGKKGRYDSPLSKVRLGNQALGILTLMNCSGTLVREVCAINSDAIPHAVNITSFPTRFARRSPQPSPRLGL